jgi:oxygen-independent coproporphyrinogen-3 oxidase
VLYIHIPFCKQRCHYCDFYFVTNTRLRADFIEALKSELISRHEELKEIPLTSIYFGGGTPSLLSVAELNDIFNCIFQYYQVAEAVEITLEANPDDLNKEYLHALRQTPINRLSIGVQSFFDEDLLYMNRAHKACESLDAIHCAAAAGFNQITIDLIYGTPGLTEERWIKNIETASSLPINHLSCYMLTVEQKTPLYKLINDGKWKAPEDMQSARQFDILMNVAGKFGFEQYEISNFARDGHYSKHNTAYWFGKGYVGVGPSAHSFDGKVRKWNVKSLSKYIQHPLESEQEILSPNDQYNEYIMTRLRTKWGIDLAEVKERMGVIYMNYLTPLLNKYIAQGDIIPNGQFFILSSKGKMYVDRISSDLFYID